MKKEVLENIIPDIIIDLRGVECPLNFVRTKIQLDKMKNGQTLEVLLDSGEAIESVPPSLLEEGHKILSKEKVDNHYKILISKNN